MDIKSSAFNKIKELKKLFTGQGLFSTEIIRKNFNYEFTVSQKSVNLKILVYFGKKGVRTVIQGKQDTPLYYKAAKLAGIEQNSLFNTSAPKNIIAPDEYIGSDESGKGDFFGPLVTVAFYCAKDMEKELTAIGVKDSKTLSENSIADIADELKNRFPENYALSALLPKEYNNRYKLIRNINTILSGEHSKVIQKLFDKFGRKKVIIDQFSTRTEKMRQELGDGLNFVTKAEKYPSVAAASILARNKFNEWFDTEPALSLNLPKGASGEVEARAKSILQKTGLDVFDEIAKIHFSTYTKIQS